MTYGDATGVKDRLNKDPTETDWDTKITRALGQADDYINNELARWGETVPLANPSTIIKDIANDWAAGILQDETSQPTQQNPLVIQGPVFGMGDVMELRQNIFTSRAKAGLTSYIRTTYSTTYITKTQPPYGAPI